MNFSVSGVSQNNNITFLSIDPKTESNNFFGSDVYTPVYTGMRLSSFDLVGDEASSFYGLYVDSNMNTVFKGGAVGFGTLEPDLDYDVEIVGGIALSNLDLWIDDTTTQNIVNYLQGSSSMFDLTDTYNMNNLYVSVNAFLPELTIATLNVSAFALDSILEVDGLFDVYVTSNVYFTGSESSCNDTDTIDDCDYFNWIVDNVDDILDTSQSLSSDTIAVLTSIQSDDDVADLHGEVV